MPPYTLAQVAKAGTATIGAATTAVLGVTVGDTTTGRILTVAAAVGTVVATYAVPNAPQVDAPADPATFDAPADPATFDPQ